MHFATDDPFIVPVAHVILDDNTAHPNGRLDPGEDVDLCFTFCNFGEPASGITATLTTSDPRLTVQQGIASLPDLGTGQSAGNTDNPFGLLVGAGIPTGSFVDLTLQVAYAGGAEMRHYYLLVGQYEYLVWDPDPSHCSGPVLHDVLTAEGYIGSYVTEFPENIDQYRSLFVCCGYYSENYVIPADGPAALAIQAFTANGGCVYLEGGDVWFYDPQYSGHDFGPLFGITGTADGGNDLATVTGMAGTFAAGMALPSIGVSSYVDHLSAYGSAYPIFRNSSPNYTCGIARDTGTYRTLGASFLFGRLGDAAPPSTKADLARAIMTFFLAENLTAIPPPAAGDLVLSAYPNPFNPQTTVVFTNPRPGRVCLVVYDIAGRRVRTLADGDFPAGRHQVVWDGRDEAGRASGSGVYLARVTVGEQAARMKLLLAK